MLQNRLGQCWTTLFRICPSTIYAITHPENVNSKNVLLKLGFRYVETFDYDGDATDWFEVKRMNLEM